jgi:phage terminase large subunit-like protein
MSWNTALPDWESRILNYQSLVPHLPLFEDYADKAVRIFSRLRCPDIEGNPTYGEICDQWVIDFVRAIFGSYDQSTKTRMLREFFMLIPKKNGKTSIAAAIMLTAAILNQRPAAELLFIAPTMKIATIAYRQATLIIKLDYELIKIFHLRLHDRTITHRVTGAILEVKASDADVITGSKATFILVDETHEFSKKSNAEDIFVEIRGSLAARPDGFLIQITTQSKNEPVGLFKAELAMARAVRDGTIQLPVLAVLYEYPKHMVESGEWKAPKNWGVVNPNLNKSVQLNFLRDEMLKAEREGRDKQRLIHSMHFNIEVGMATHDGGWRGADYWDAAADESLTLEELMARSDVITVGIDGGGLDDLFGLCVEGRCATTGDSLAWYKGWVQRDVLKLRPELAALFIEFAKQGDLVLCDHTTQDIEEIAAIVAFIHGAGLLPEQHCVGLDPYGITALLQELAKHNIGGEMLMSIRQGTALSPAIWSLERKLKDGTFWHNGSAFMRWIVGNAKAEQRGNATLITKQTAGRAKIDPLVAGFNAEMLMSRNPVVGGVSYLESGSMVSL